MEFIGRAHRALARIAPDVVIDLLASDDVRERIRAAVESTPPRRRSPLHPALVMWLCLALALFRADSVPNAFARLLARWRGLRTWVGLRPVTDGALAHARARLGPAPVRRLFESLGATVSPEPTFHGRRVWSLDGTVLCAPDTPANEAAFGRHRSGRGRTAFPQLRLVTLTASRTHEIRDAHWIPYAHGERETVPDVTRNLRKGDLVLLDRGFQACWIYDHLMERGVDFVVRLGKSARPRRLARRGPGDFDVEVVTAMPHQLRDGWRLRVRARLVEYHIGRGPKIRLLTSLSGPDISALDIALLYQERWEAEIAFDEIKTHFASVRHGTLHLPFRGKSPAMVEQELWATLAAYSLVRRLLAAAAQVHRIDPRRISFTDAVAVITSTYHPGGLEGPALLRAYVRFVSDLADCVLSRWRRPRACPRAVRIKTCQYAYKKRRARSRYYDPVSTLRVGPSRCA